MFWLPSPIYDYPQIEYLKRKAQALILLTVLQFDQGSLEKAHCYCSWCHLTGFNWELEDLLPGPLLHKALTVTGRLSLNPLHLGLSGPGFLTARCLERAEQPFMTQPPSHLVSLRSYWPHSTLWGRTYPDSREGHLTQARGWQGSGRSHRRGNFGWNIKSMTIPM